MRSSVLRSSQDAPDRQGAGNLPGVDNTRDPTQDGQTDVDQEVAVAAGFEEDSKRRQEERQEV